jgi:hypothetical protein
LKELNMAMKKPTNGKTPAAASNPTQSKTPQGGKPPAAKPGASNPTTTPVRNSAYPRSAATSPATTAPARPTITPRREISHEAIARRAFEISQSPEGRSPEENWFRAERELRNGR